MKNLETPGKTGELAGMPLGAGYLHKLSLTYSSVRTYLYCVLFTSKTHEAIT